MQEPLVFADEIETRPVIARIMSVPEWRELYLERLRLLAERELDWKILGERITLWRDLLMDAVDEDPFLGDTRAFRSSLDGPDNSLKTIAEQRRNYLLRHPDLNKDEPATDKKS